MSAFAQKLIPSLWFEKDGEEAANFYVSLLPNSRIETLIHAPADFPDGRAGQVLTVEVTLAGQRYTILNGGPHFKLSEAFSIQIMCDDQAEVDRLFAALSAEPDSGQCGWVKDRWGLSWQIVPRRMIELMTEGDAAQKQRVFDAMMQMKKLDIAGLEAAAKG
jgi:predicted 3-demethylubiquinone-9 3-methyltransferase (glyoxalase superfamily)